MLGKRISGVQLGRSLLGAYALRIGWGLMWPMHYMEAGKHAR